MVLYTYSFLFYAFKVKFLYLETLLMMNNHCQIILHQVLYLSPPPLTISFLLCNLFSKILLCLVNLCLYLLANALSNARISGLLMKLSSSSIALSTLLISYAIPLISSLSFCNTCSLFSSSFFTLLPACSH